MFTLALTVALYHVVLSVVAWSAGWPPQFGGKQDPEQSYAEFLVGGSAISAPLPPLLLLLLGGRLSERSSPWRVLGLLLVAVVAALFVIGVLGELVADHPHVPFPVVVVFGVVNMMIGLVLVLSAASYRRSKKT